MMYTKPSNVTYVEMAIYVDKNIRKEDRDDMKCFEYLWHLFYILAVKGRLFTTGRDYDEYALYGASKLFLRYQKEAVKPSLTPIKSCLNYIKKVLYPLKVDYQKANFGQVFKEEVIGEIPFNQLKENKVRRIRQDNFKLARVEYEQYLHQLNSTIKDVLKDIPYNNASERHNIHLSCLLTLLKMITMSNVNKERVRKREDRTLSVESLVDSIYLEESKENVVLYHLDSSMSNYINTLVNKIKKEIVKDLRYIIGSSEPPDQVIKDILISPISDTGGMYE